MMQFITRSNREKKKNRINPDIPEKYNLRRKTYGLGNEKQTGSNYKT